MYKHIKNLAFITGVSIIIILCLSECRRHPCHTDVTVVNNSDSTVSICKITCGYYYKYWLGKVIEIEPQKSTTIRMAPRTDCLEDLSSYAPGDLFTLCVLPEEYTLIETSSYDSLFIVYDVLKIINLQELGIDYLEKTDFKVYYP